MIESPMPPVVPLPVPTRTSPHAGAIRRVLVVDDSKLQRKLLTIALKNGVSMLWRLKVGEKRSALLPRTVRI